MDAVVILAVAIVGGLVLEALVVRRQVSAIAIRVHINGTRGKSSVTRYVAAALRQAGYRVLGKITGGRPTILLPDGAEEVILRRGPARVQEQIRMVRRARRLGCNALVLECMSIVPSLQRLESQILRSTVSVLTNILDDHREEFGSGAKAHVEALCSFLPEQGTVISNEAPHGIEVNIAAARRGTRVRCPSPADFHTADSLMEESHRENVALAMAVCRELGVPEDIALRGIRGEIRRGEGALIDVRLPAGQVRFVNGFAVNDVASASAFLEEWRRRLDGWAQLALVLNTRADRPLRSLQFARWCAGLEGLSRLVLVGTHVHRTMRELVFAGIDRGKLVRWTRKDLASPVEALAALELSPRSVVMGFGNIAGDGQKILESLHAWS